MQLALSSISQKRLITVKSLFNEACAQSNRYGMTANIIASITFDLSIETLLNVVFSAIDDRKTPPETFNGLMQGVEELMISKGYGDLPDRANIVHVHKMRNDVQHRAKSITNEDLIGIKIYSRDILHKLIRTVWGIEFSSLNLADLIRDPSAKAFITKSESFLVGENKNIKECVKFAAAGLKIAMRHTTRQAGRRSLNAIKEIAFEKFGKVARDNRKSEELLKALQTMQDSIDTLMFDIDKNNLNRLHRLSGVINIAESGEIEQTYFESVTISADDATFVLAYAIDTILKIENTIQASSRESDHEI